MRASDSNCYVLRCWAYSENSKILDVFTRDHGRISVLAKGICKLKSPLRLALQPFAKLQLRWSGKSSLKVLTQVDESLASRQLVGIRLISALYLNELLRLTLNQQEVQTALFNEYDQALSCVRDQHDFECAIRYFEFEILRTHGYAAELGFDYDQKQYIRPELDYVYQFEQGWRAAGPDDGSHSIAGSTLLALANRRLRGAAQRRQSKRLLRLLLRHYLGSGVQSWHLLHAIYQDAAAPRTVSKLQTTTPQAA